MVVVKLDDVKFNNAIIEVNEGGNIVIKVDK